MTDEPSDPQLFQNLWAKEAPANSVSRPTCACLEPQYNGSSWSELALHTEEQDTNCDGWHRLNELIDAAVQDGRKEFSPGPEMSPSEWAQITVLPASISRLKAVKHLILYGSSLVRIPPEIGEMESLEEFTPYTSYRLHWFPYEILHCENLKQSTISTRALYGNFKYRSPFPRLPQFHRSYFPSCCSVCSGPLDENSVKQLWVSLPSGSDVVPLLAHVCSDQCVAQIPTPTKNYIPTPHTGGLGLEQPETYY